jgi:hypothetical protein
MRLIATIVLLTILRGPDPALADPETDAGFALAAFACAVLAAESSEVSGNRQYASPLASKALPKAQATGGVILQLYNSPASPDNGPLGAFLKTVGPDFMAGLYFAQAQKEIDDLLPKAGAKVESYDDFKLHRETEADLEFAHRNCKLIGG